MSKLKKTNAMRILDQNKVDYKYYEYDSNDGIIDGVSVAKKINVKIENVYKTLVLKGLKEYYVCIIPVKDSLNLKFASKHFSEKKIEMIPVKDILKITGYIRGGCSPIGMKKKFRTVLDESILKLDKIIFSGGRIGLQLEVEKEAFIKITKADLANITKLEVSY